MERRRTQDPDNDLPREALDDDVFVKLMEEEFERGSARGTPGAGKTALRSGESNLPSNSDVALKNRVWAKIEAQMVAHPNDPARASVPPSPDHKKETVAAGNPAERTHSASQEHSSRGEQARSEKRSFTPLLLGILGVATAVALFLRVGPKAREENPVDPSHLEGAAEAIRASLEVTRDQATDSFTFALNGGDPSLARAALFFSSGGAPAVLVGTGLFAPGAAGSEKRTLVGESNGAPLSFELPRGQTEGRLCLFPAETPEGLGNIVSVAPKVFERHPEELCANVTDVR